MSTVKSPEKGTKKTPQKNGATIVGQPETDRTGKIPGIKYRDIEKEVIKWESSAFMELSLGELENVLFKQINVLFLENPIWQDDENDHDQDDSNDDGNDDIKLVDYDLLDSPDDEINIEYGEGELFDRHSESGGAENFSDYIWRHFMADFIDEDLTLRSVVKKYLEDWKYPYFPLTQYLQLKEEHRFLLPWFEGLGAEYGATIDKAMTKNYATAIPDIIFTINQGGEITYEINLGILDRLLVPGNAQELMKISEKGSGIPMGILNQLIMVRRANLCLLAEYLRSEQKDFILAPSFPEGVKKLKLIQQKDFIRHLEKLGIEKTKDEMTRIIKGKHIQIPFCNMVLPARICFSRPVKNLKKIDDAERVLDVAFDLHITQNSGAPLTAPEQAAIISAVLDCEYSASNVSRTIWKKMRGRIAKKLWPELRIIGQDEQGNTIKNERNKLSPEDLHRLCKEVKDEMER
jgi:hypothetical protein